MLIAQPGNGTASGMSAVKSDMAAPMRWNASYCMHCLKVHLPHLSPYA